MTPWVKRLLIANIGIFFLTATVPGLSAPLVLVPAAILSRPWTLLTYMFLHGSVMHLLFNMIGLYFFGPRLEERLGESHFVRLYLISGLVGALLSFVFTPYARIVGASGAIFGVMLGFAWYWPRERIYIWGVLPVEARLLVIITTALALFGGFGGGASGTAHFAHLGGYLGGLLYLWWFDRRSPARKFKQRIVEQAHPRVDERSLTKIDYSSIHEVNRGEVDRILDKISASGVQSLTPAERTFLEHFRVK